MNDDSHVNDEAQADDIEVTGQLELAEAAAELEFEARAEAEVAAAAEAAEADAGAVEVEVPAVAEESAEDEAEVEVEAAVAEAPAARRRSRRTASRPAGPPPAMFSAAPEPHPVRAEVPAGRPSAAMVAAVFQAPEPVAAPPARRSPRPVEIEDEVDEVTELVAEEVEAEVEATDEADQADQADQAQESEETNRAKRRRRRGGRGRGRKSEVGEEAEAEDGAGEKGAAGEEAESGTGDDGQPDADSEDESGEGGGSRRRRRRRRKGAGDGEGESGKQAAPERRTSSDEVTAVKGSTRLEAKKQRRREGRVNRGSRAPILTEAEFLARRESVDRQMVVRQRGALTQIAVLEDDVLVEHYVASEASTSMIGNVYLGRVQNVLPSMEAAFVDIGRGRNAVLYAGEVNWDAAGLEGQPKRIELALKSGDTVLVQVTKDPVGHKGARLTSQISLPGRFLVYVPSGGMTGISRKLPDLERSRLKKILRSVVPDDAGVIVRTAAEGASEEQLQQDVERLQQEWDRIVAAKAKAAAPSLLRSEPDLTLKVARDIFNEDFSSMVVSGDRAYDSVHSYVEAVAPDLGARVSKWVDKDDVFHAHRIDEQLAKALDRKVWLPSGGSLVIDHTEAMTVIDVNTGKFVGQGGNLEETVTRNNLEAAEEIVRQLRLRDLGGIIVVDFIDMVLESNRDLVVRRLVECLSRDRTKHQVAEVTSLGLVQMTRKRIGQGLMETFSTPCETCHGRGVKVQAEPVGQTGAERTASTPRRRPKIAGPIPGAPTQPKGAEQADEPHADETHDHDHNVAVDEAVVEEAVVEEAAQAEAVVGDAAVAEAAVEEAGGQTPATTGADGAVD